MKNQLCPTDLGIIMSYQCQCACKHCLYNCGPRWKDWMSPQTLREALQATSAWHHRFQIHLTGGEPFLNFPLLLDGVRLAAKLGIPCYVETNAGWCLREADVADKFTTLKEAGLNAILISCSPFHAEKIPPARTFLAIHKALEVFGRQGVIVYLPQCLEQVQLFDVEKTTPIEHYVERFGPKRAGRILWDGYSIISGGRSGYALGHLTRKRPASAFKGQNCFLEIIYAHHSHFDLYGNYISWFCGGLTIGDWHSLPRVLDHLRKRRFPPLVDILVRAGPFGLFEMGKAEYATRSCPRVTPASATCAWMCEGVSTNGESLRSYDREGSMKTPYWLKAYWRKEHVAAGRGRRGAATGGCTSEPEPATLRTDLQGEPDRLAIQRAGQAAARTDTTGVRENRPKAGAPT